MKLTCGTHFVVTFDTLKVCTSTIGCSMVGGNDLYDLGFTVANLIENDLIVEIGDEKIVFECENTQRKRMIKDFMEEGPTTETAAKLFLQREQWNYARAMFNFRVMKLSRGMSKACGEIALGPSQPCNLGTAEFQAQDRRKLGVTLESVIDTFNEKLRAKAQNEVFAKFYGGVTIPDGWEILLVGTLTQEGDWIYGRDGIWNAVLQGGKTVTGEQITIRKKP